jgi:type II secretory pathway pseudopilin PulG
MGRGTILSGKNKARGRFPREGGWSLIELTVTLVLLMAIALFGMQTMVAGVNLQKWAIAQSMTDAYAGIETAFAQRYVFADIPSGGTSGVARWGVYPLAVTAAAVQIGQTPSQSVTANVIRTYRAYADPVTGAVSYLLESYVVYQNGPQKYCKVSKVYRDQ